MITIRTRLTVWAMALTAISSTVAAVPSIDLRDAWQSHPGVFAKAVRPGVGFSFLYGGKAVGPQPSPEWKQSVTHDARSGTGAAVLTHASGLTVTRQTRVFPSFGAVEYSVRFKNAGSRTLPAISGLHALNVSFGEVHEGNCVVSSGGGVLDSFLPPRTFAIRKQCFTPTVASSGVIDLTTEGGRSSNRDLPFLFVQNDAREEGMFIAIGWSGQWGARVQNDAQTGVLTVRGKIQDLEIALEPGEEIQGPTILVGLYQGALADGSNRLRRLIREQYTPKLSGKAVLPVAMYDTWWNIGPDFDEAMLKKLAHGAAAAGQEYFLLDAGWFAHPSGPNGWLLGTGNWQEVNKEKLPNGLKPVAEYVRSVGLEFGLWFEPERVAEGSQLAREHPDWILWKGGKVPDSFAWTREIHPGMAWADGRYGVLDYGRPEVQRWVGEMMDRYIRDLGLKYIRYDFNFEPLSYWEANDQPGRRGMTQLRHIQGFYAVIDGLRERHPGTVFEGCASGGRRIDLETARRFHTMLISDHVVDPAIVRFHLFGINHFLPGNYNVTAYTLLLPGQKSFHADDVGFQSQFGGSFGTGGRVDLWPEEMTQKARAHVQTWKQLRRYLVEDYYPLSSQPGDLESWSGWQFNDPKDGSGFMQTFRTKTTGATHRFFVKGLEGRARYRFTDANGADSFEMTGQGAMQAGIEIAQQPMTSKVLIYRKISQPEQAAGDGDRHP